MSGVFQRPASSHLNQMFVLGTDWSVVRTRPWLIFQVHCTRLPMRITRCGHLLTLVDTCNPMTDTCWPMLEWPHHTPICDYWCRQMRDRSHSPRSDLATFTRNIQLWLLIDSESKTGSDQRTAGLHTRFSLRWRILWRHVLTGAIPSDGVGRRYAAMYVAFHLAGSVTQTISRREWVDQGSRLPKHTCWETM